MEDKKIKVSVIAAGQRFNILTEKSEKYVLDIASKIDARIHSLVVSGDMTRERAAVLTAMDLADDNEEDKENLAAVKEQMKDYLHQIERLSDNNAKLMGDYGKLKEEYERLVAQNQSAEDAQKALKESLAENEKLKGQIKSLEDSLAALENKQAESVTEPEIKEAAEIEDREEPPTVTAEDDLFFDMEEEEQVKPLPQKKKSRHEHKHVNPYKQNAEKKKEQKGYTQQRQYSFFDINEE